jgi:hypothetical protein
MTNRLTLALLCAASAITLSACEKTKEQFDFSKKAPDEFAVVKRAPLEMPPDYTLRPPRPGAPRPQELATDEQARAAVIGGVMGQDATTTNAAPVVRGVSAGENILLQKTGAANANPNIRAIVDKEAPEIAEDQMTGLDKMKRAVGQDIKDPATVVDPKAEVERMKAGQKTAPTPTKTSK